MTKLVCIETIKIGQLEKIKLTLCAARYKGRKIVPKLIVVEFLGGFIVREVLIFSDEYRYRSLFELKLFIYFSMLKIEVEVRCKKYVRKKVSRVTVR